MKKLLSVFLSIVLIAVFCACNKKALDDLRLQIEDLKSSQITTIQQQITNIKGSLQSLETTDTELQAFIEKLQKQEAALAESVRESVSALQAKDDDLQALIADLKAYVDKDLKAYVEKGDKNVTDWVNATFSTLEQYQGLLSTIEGIRADITSLSSVKTEVTEAYTAAINAAITASENSMQSWVNKQLTGYYTIAEMDAKISALEKAIADGDEDQAAELDKLKTALETAKTDIKTAYEKAIADAISTSEGQINEKIAADIKTATDALQSQIDAINTRLDELEARISSLEKTVESLINHIQSISVIPGYADGSVGISSSSTEICFEIHPVSVAEALVKIGKTLFSVSAVYSAQTKAISQVSLPVESVSYNNGIVSVFVSGEPLSQDFYKGQASASARLCVSSGTIECASQYFSLYPAGLTTQAVAYNAWIGQWTIGSTAKDDKPVVITISQKDENSTYNIDGLEGVNTQDNNITVTGTFEEDGSLSIYAQELSEWTNSTYGPATNFLAGQIIVEGATYFMKGNYLMTNIKLSTNGEGVMLRGSVSDTNGSVYSVVGMKYYWVVSAGAGNYSNVNTPLPNKLIPVAPNAAATSATNV